MLKGATLGVQFMQRVHGVKSQQRKGVHVKFAEFPCSGCHSLGLVKTQVKLQSVIIPSLSSLSNDRGIGFSFLWLGCVVEDPETELVFFEDSLVELFELGQDFGVEFLVGSEDFGEFGLDEFAQKLDKLHLLIFVNIKIVKPFHKVVHFLFTGVVLSSYRHLNGFELCLDAGEKLIELELLFGPLNEVAETIPLSSFGGPWHKVVKYLHLLRTAAPHLLLFRS